MIFFSCKITPAHRNKLGQLIGRARIQHGWTQGYLAEQIGCSSRWLQCIEYGQGNPGWRLFLQLITVLELTPQELVNALGFEKDLAE